MHSTDIYVGPDKVDGKRVPKRVGVVVNARPSSILLDEGVNLTPFCYERWAGAQELGFCITSLANVALQHDRF